MSIIFRDTNRQTTKNLSHNSIQGQISNLYKDNEVIIELDVLACNKSGQGKLTPIKVCKIIHQISEHNKRGYSENQLGK